MDAPRVSAANYNHYYSKPVVNFIIMMIMMMRVRLGVLPLLLVQVQVVTGSGSDYRDVCHRDFLGPGVFVLQNDGCPPLVMASINGHAATIRVLLEQGAVADRPRVRVPRRYLLVHRSKVDTQPEAGMTRTCALQTTLEGATALHLATQHGMVDAVTALLDGGATVNSQKVVGAHASLSDLLVGPPPSHADGAASAAYYYLSSPKPAPNADFKFKAVCSSYRSLESESHSESRSLRGTSRLSCGILTLTPSLTERCCVLWPWQVDGVTPLWTACMHNQVEVARVLLDRGASLVLSHVSDSECQWPCSSTLRLQ